MNEVRRGQEAVSVCVLVLRERDLRSIAAGKVYIKCDHEGEAKRRKEGRKGGERKVSRRDAELCGRCSLWILCRSRL